MIFYKENEFQDSPIGKIPKEWESRSLKNVVASCENGVWGDEPSSSDDSYPVIRSTEITHDGKIDLSSVARRKIPEERVERYALENGDILVVGSSGSAHLIGRTALFLNPDNGKYLFSNFMIRIRPRNTNPYFLHYFLNSGKYFGFLRRLQQTSTGLRNLQKKEFLRLNVPFPPLPEQKAVVGVLGVVDSAIGLVDRVIWKTERLKKGLMQTLLTRGIGHNEYKDTPIGKTPKTWQTAELGGVCNQRSEIIQPSREGTNIFIGLEHITSGEVTTHSYSSDLDIRSSKFRFYPKDILYGKLRPYLDKAVLVDFDGISSTDLLVLTAQKEKALPEFLIYVLHSSEFIKHAIATTTGTNHPRTSWKAISKFEFGLPQPSEQQRIAEILFAVNKKLDLERKEKARLERVKRGLMDLLLTGKVRVKVD